jgi:hypothetical protein
MARGACFFCLILLAATTVFAQTCTTYVVVDTFNDKTHFGIDGLKAEDFEAQMGNASLPVISATQSFNNRVLVLTERSGSADIKEVDALVRGIAAKARTAPTGRPIAFGAFAEESFIGKEFLTDQQRRSSAIDEVLAHAAQLPGKYVSLFDSLHQAIAVFGPHQPGDTILLLTDGHDNKSKRNLNDMKKEFAASGTRLLVVIRPKFTPSGVFRDFQQHVREENLSLKILSSSTGGAYTNYRNDRFLEFAWAGYLLGIQAPATLNKPKAWKLQIRNSNGKIDKNVLLYSPWQLTPCGPVTTAAR